MSNPPEETPMNDNENNSYPENMNPTPPEMANVVPPEGPRAMPEREMPENVNARLERLGGEPAPDITPEEFARLRQSGQIHIDPRGRVRSRRNNNEDAGVSLRKRRAWYAG